MSTSQKRVKETDEVIEDVTQAANYIVDTYMSENAAIRLVEEYRSKIAVLSTFPKGYRGIGLEYRGYEIHLLPFRGYNVFFIVREKESDVVILRVLHQLQNWTKILKFGDEYHIDQMAI